MQPQQLFEYAVIRVVPRVEREEFLNVGVILYCARMNFLRSLYAVDHKRVCAFSKDLDVAAIEQNLLAMQRICNDGINAGPIGKLDAASRFRWLTATRSTVVQTSRVHPGFTNDPGETLLRLFHQLVL